MTRTEKAIEDARIHLGKCFYPDKRVIESITIIETAYFHDMENIRFKAKIYTWICLGIGLVIGLIINA